MSHMASAPQITLRGGGIVLAYLGQEVKHCPACPALPPPTLSASSPRRLVLGWEPAASVDQQGLGPECGGPGGRRAGARREDSTEGPQRGTLLPSAVLLTPCPGPSGPCLGQEGPREGRGPCHGLRLQEGAGRHPRGTPAGPVSSSAINADVSGPASVACSDPAWQPRRGWGGLLGVAAGLRPCPARVRRVNRPRCRGRQPIPGGSGLLSCQVGSAAELGARAWGLRQSPVPATASPCVELRKGNGGPCPQSGLCQCWGLPAGHHCVPTSGLHLALPRLPLLAALRAQEAPSCCCLSRLPPPCAPGGCLGFSLFSPRLQPLLVFCAYGGWAWASCPSQWRRAQGAVHKGTTV